MLLLLLAAPLLAPAQRRASELKVKNSKFKIPLRAARAAHKAAPKAIFNSKLLIFNSNKAPAFTQYLHSPWVDSLMRVLTPDQRVAQLFMVAAYSNRQRIDEDSVSALVQQYGVGGLIFFQGGPVRQSKLLNRYQAQARVPLLVALDGEWGAGMRLDSIEKFPYQMSLGAVAGADTALLYGMGAEVARQFRRLGMHVNFAPVVDVNNNAANPVIGFRSWGETPAAVARASRQYMRGLQDAGVLAVAKHFPGHGDVDVDSHLALPTVRVDRRRLDSLELPPFRNLIANGLGGVMVAHLNVPALDSTGTPTTLSRPVITGMLRGQLGFNGLIFTDAMNMKGVTSRYPPGEADVRALQAGNDILEFSRNVPLALQMVRAAVDSGRISQKEIDQHCRRVLALKQWAGLRHYQPVALQNLVADLNPPHARYLSHRLTELSLTLLRNQKSLLPLRRLDTLRVATLVLGGAPRDTTAFQKAVTDYVPTAHFHAAANPTLDELMHLREALKPYNLVLVSLQSLGRLPATNFGIAPEANVLLRELAGQQKTLVLSVFGSAYAVAKVRDLDRAAAVVLAYQESPDAQSLAAQLIFGGVGAQGTLPVTVANNLPRGFGLKTEGGLRLRYANPEDVGLDGRLEARVDSLVGRALAVQAVPGCQVVVARNGTVVLRKSYGNQTYAGEIIVGNERNVRNGKNKLMGKNASPAFSHSSTSSTLTKPRLVADDDLYDLASLTKLLAATPALLRLQQEGKFSPDSTLGNYFPFLRGTNKANLNMREVLAHQARLKAWIPFWKELTNRRGGLRRRYFHADSSARFPLLVARGLWGSRKLPARINKEIGASPLNAKPGYVYSDLSFMLYPQLVRARSGLAFEDFLRRDVYRPLGATTLGFRPARRFPLARIVPTEYDSTFRRQLLHGTVHDEGAALLGGFSGHAGLFGNANDVAKLVQTYAWGGRYGGQQLFDKKILADWTSCQFCPDNHRALAFDRPAADPGVNFAKSSTLAAYGHTGFTGTAFYVEPQYGLVVVFLSNRVHPTRRNAKLSELGVRTGLMQVVIESVLNP